MTKYHCLLLVLGLTLCSCVAPKYRIDEQISVETVDLRILKVFYAQEGDAIFRAYLVNWEGQDIPIVATQSFQEGDVIAVRVSNRPFPRGRERHRLLSFGIAPFMSTRLAPPVDPQWGREAIVRKRKDRQNADLDVLEVYSAKQGEAIFNAYRAKWKGQEIVVIDDLAKREQKKGGVISVMVGKVEYPPGREPQGQPPHRMLRFSLSPVPFGTESEPHGFSTRRDGCGRWLWRLVERSRCAAHGTGHIEEDGRFFGADEEIDGENIVRSFCK